MSWDCPGSSHAQAILDCALNTQNIMLQISESSLKTVESADFFFKGSYHGYFQDAGSNLPSVDNGSNFSVVFKCFKILLGFVPSANHPLASLEPGLWSVSWLLTFLLYWLESDPFVHSLEETPGVDKQLYRIAFLSSSLIIISPVLSSSLGLPVLVLWSII